jgi:putative nucleotidyltransferase with HDIG domain
MVNTMTSVATPGNDQLTPLQQVLRRIDEISTLPHIAMRIIEVANDNDAGPADLRKVLEVDASLSARVLRYANSSAFALRSKTTNLQVAISYLGFAQIRNLAVTASVSGIFKQDQAIGAYRRINLWRHLVSVGVCARLIAMRKRMPNFEDAFLAGLLHDIGIILADQHAHEQFAHMLAHFDGGKSLCENERQHLGFDHLALGDEMAKAWNFPEAVRASIRHHHGSSAYNGAGTDIVRCVEAANIVCTLKSISSIGVNALKPSADVFNKLSFGKPDIEVLSQDLDTALEQNSELFSI